VRTRSFVVLAVMVAAVAPALPLHAAIAWDQASARVNATAGDADLVVYYRFHNRGAKPLTLVAARPDCDCTQVSFTPGAIPAGATGVVKAVFSVGERVGAQRKSILVYDDDAPDKPSRLTLEVDIAEVVAYRPRIARWQIGEKPAERMIELVPTGTREIKAIADPRPVPGFTSRLEAVDGGRSYRLYLQPLSTRERQSVVVRCDAKLADGATAPVTVYALVR
jgi:hypothetical protein